MRENRKTTERTCKGVHGGLLHASWLNAILSAQVPLPPIQRDYAADEHPGCLQ